jgi:glycerol-3-phosphate dehydrogenase
MLHLSKGVHVVLPASRVPLRNILLLSPGDGRSIFAIRRGDVVFLGTTDTTYEHGPGLWPEVSLEDVQYLIEPLSRYLSIEPVTPSEVITAWSGLRPLVAEPGKKPTDISRKDEVAVSRAGVVTVAGGKLTGYRPTVERVLQSVAQVLGRELPDVNEGPLPGGDFDGDLDRLARSLVGQFGVSEATGARLARLYGCESPEVAAMGTAPVVEDSPVLAGEIGWGVLKEGAARVEDVVYRRTRAALYEPEAARRIVQPVAEHMGELLGWDGQRIGEEAEETRGRLASDLSFGGSGT